MKVRSSPVYIRVSSKDAETIEELKKTASENIGDTELIFYLSDIKRSVRLKGVPSVSMTDSVLEKLQHIAGQDNVLFKY